MNDLFAANSYTLSLSVIQCHTTDMFVTPNTHHADLYKILCSTSNFILKSTYHISVTIVSKS